jgi:hypothetical protein
LGAILKQEEIAVVKAISTMELSPALLRELREAMAARKRSKAKLPCVAAFKRHAFTSVAGNTDQHSGKPSQHSAAKSKTEEFSRSDGSTVPASISRSRAVELSGRQCRLILVRVQCLLV